MKLNSEISQHVIDDLNKLMDEVEQSSDFDIEVESRTGKLDRASAKTNNHVDADEADYDESAQDDDVRVTNQDDLSDALFDFATTSIVSSGTTNHAKSEKVKVERPKVKKAGKNQVMTISGYDFTAISPSVDVSAVEPVDTNDIAKDLLKTIHDFKSVVMFKKRKVLISTNLGAIEVVKHSMMLCLADLASSSSLVPAWLTAAVDLTENTITIFFGNRDEA